MLSVASTWDCKLLFNHKSPPGGNEDLVDLCDPLESGFDYQFPPHNFHGVDSLVPLINELKLAAIQCG
jgi:hypothetical protein